MTEEENLLSEQARKLALLRQTCKQSAHTFSEELLEYEGEKRYKNPWHIKVIYDLLDNFLTQDPVTGKIVINKVGKVNRKIVIECPRNHAKSTAVSVNWALKELYRDSNQRIVICSNALSQASAFLREQKAHIERGDKLNQIMGALMPRYPEKWTDTSIIVNRSTKKKDPSISTTGTGGAVLSKRADIVILDDLLNPENALTITQGWDLAISQSARADWTVGVTLGRDDNGNIYLLNIERGKFTPAEIRNKIITQAALFKPSKIKVETVAFQEAIRRDLADATDLPIEGYATGGEKYDEYVGINSVGVLFENRKIILPCSSEMTENEKKLIDQFVYECEAFGAESHTGDILVAFWLAINGLRDLQSKGQEVYFIKTSGLYDVRRNDKRRQPWDDDDW